MPQDDALERAKRKLAAGPKVPRAPEGGSPGDIPLPGPPSPQKPSRREYVAENPAQDVWYMVRGFGEGLLWAFQRIGEVAGDPASYGRDVKLLFSGNYFKESGSAVLGGFTENWKDDEGNFAPFEALVNRPFSSISDLFAIKSLIAKSGALAAKAAGGVSRMRLAPGLAAKVGPMTKADKALALAEKLDRAPWPSVGRAIKKAVPGSLADALGQGKHTRAIGRFKANEYAAESLAAADDLLKIASRDVRLLDADKVALRKAVRIGSQETLGALSPVARKWYDNFAALVTGPEGQEAFLKGTGVLSGYQAVRANAIGAALEAFGDTSRPNQKLALAKMKSGEWKPIYASLYAVRDSGFGFLESFGQSARRLVGKYSRLEKRTGKGVYEDDIVAIAAKQTIAFHATKARLRLLDRVVDHLQKSGEVKAIRTLDDLPEGYTALPDGLFKKYYEVMSRAGAVYLRERLHGLATPEAMRVAYSEIISDPALRRSLVQERHIAVPKHVARYIQMEFNIPTPGVRIYDKLANYWKAMATVWRPQYWLSVAVGNGLLAAIHGVGPEDLARVRKYAHLLPPEIRSRLQTDITLPGINAFERVSKNLREYASVLDETVLRQPVFSKEVEAVRRDTHSALMRLGASGFAAFDTVDDPQKFAQMVAVGPEKLSEAARRTQALYEQVAAGSPRLIEMKKGLETLYREVDDLERAAARGAVGLPKRSAFATTKRLDDLKKSAKALETGYKAEEAAQASRLTEAGRLRAALPELEQIAQWADDAVIAGNRLAGDWLRAHPLDRLFFSRAVPFYGYTKMMTLFVARLPFVYPKRFFFWNRWSQMAMEQRNMEEYPDWLKSYIPVGHTADGSTVFIRLAGLLPWSGVRMGEMGGVPIPKQLDPTSANPLLKVIFELKGGTPEWTQRPWSTDETMVRMDNGEVYKFDSVRRGFRKTIVQPSLWRSLWYLFPHAQMIEEALVPYVMTDRGWLGYPEPIPGPAGPMYPKQLAERLLSAIGPRVSLKNAEEVKRQKRRSDIRVLREFSSEIRRERNPEKREAMLEVLRDAIEGRSGE